MAINRRGFLGSLAALGAVGVVKDAAAKETFRPAGALRLKAGVFSDLHITDEASTGIVETAHAHGRG